MPDSHRSTISATEAPALWNQSRYLTRWMLHQRFANGRVFNEPEDEVMREGRRLQPFVMERAAKELRLEVLPNEEDIYVRRGQLGATRDGIIVCPDRGLGAIEIKCVFRYDIWGASWAGGDRPPREHEIQLQTQMHVGDGTEPLTWGIIVAWVCGSMFYFERKPDLPFQDRLVREAAQFFDDVEMSREPDPFGAEIELDLLAEVHPTEEGRVLDLREVEGAKRFTQQAITYQRSHSAESANGAVAKAIRAEFFALKRGASVILLPNATVRFDRGNRIKVNVQGQEVGDE